jgi:hypothetical protein
LSSFNLFIISLDLSRVSWSEKDKIKYISFIRIFYYFFNQYIRNPEKTTDPLQVTDKLYHILLYPVHLA